MKFLWMAMMVFGGTMLCAGTAVDINGSFAGSKVGDKTPAKWTFNTSIRPEGTGKVVQTGDKLGVEITNSNSKRRHVAYFTRTIRVTAGEQYEITCDAEGTGKATLSVYFYAKGAWGGSISSPATALKPGVNNLKLAVTVPAEIKGKVPIACAFAFTAAPGTDAVFTNFAVTKKAAE